MEGTGDVQEHALYVRLRKGRGANSTGTFKARGMAMVVSMVRYYGPRKVGSSLRGNAADALTAYAAAAGIKAHIFMPRDVLFANYVEAVAYELMNNPAASGGESDPEGIEDRPVPPGEIPPRIRRQGLTLDACRYPSPL